MNTGKASQQILRSLSFFIDSYAGSHLTQSEDTLRSYRATLRKYLDFLEFQKGINEKNIDKSCFERKTIEEWMRYMLNEEKLTAATCNIRLGNLRTFLKYLSSCGPEFKYLYTDAAEIPLMKTEKKKVEGLTRQAVKAIMAEPDQFTITGRRDLVFITTTYCTAGRISEILSIRIKDIHIESSKPSITIIGKGNKMRTMYLLPKAVAHIKKFIQEAHGDHPDPDNYLFYSRNGGKKNKLTSKAIEKRLKMYAEKAHSKCEEVPLGLHAHQLRHARATHWLEEGMNIIEISTLLGHEQLSTTMVYLDIGIEAELKALATLEDENDTKLSCKWRTGNTKLSDLIK